MESNDLRAVYRYILAQRAECTGTDEQKQSLRTYFLARSVSEAAQLSHRWCSVGKEICKIIAGVPWMLEVFLGCGYGRTYITSMFMQVLQHDNPTAFLNIIQYDPLYEQFAARHGDETFYRYMWIHYVPFMRDAILDTYLQINMMVIDAEVFLSIIPSLSPTKLEFILNHPQHTYLVYKLTSPYAYIENKVRLQYTSDTSCMSDPYVIRTYGINKYINAERLWKEIKQTRRAYNWRLLFWSAVLHSRMMEFRERYWALSGKPARAAAAEFYSLSSLPP